MRNVVTKLSLLLAFTAAVAVSQAHALIAGSAPEALMSNVTLDVLDILKEDRIDPLAEPARTASLVEARLQPVFDFERMTRLALARNWRLASPEQQRALIAEFTTLLVRAYSAVLGAYCAPEIEFKPLQGAAGDGDIVTIRSATSPPRSHGLTIAYDLQKAKDEWKVFDVRIGGLSLIATYRDAFADQIREGGVGGLLQALELENRRYEQRGDARMSGPFAVVLFYALARKGFTLVR